MLIEFTFLNYLQTLHTPQLNAFFLGLTHLVDYLWYVLTLALIFYKPTRKVGIVLALALIAQYLIGSGIIKRLVARPRPCDISTAYELLVKRPRGYSFPSGHSSMAMSVVGVLYGARLKWLLAPVTICAQLVVFSRMYLYVHFPTDVLAGSVLGFSVGYACWRWLKDAV